MQHIPSSSSISTRPSRHLFGDERGQGMVEYLVLVVLVGIFAITIVGIFGDQVESTFDSITKQVEGLQSVSEAASHGK